MVVTEHVLDVGGSSICVLDYGGSGVDVLLVHSPGYCAPAWDEVARALGGRVHAYAVDLPGHGHSTGDLVDAARTRSLLAQIVEALELDRPVLVGVDFAGYYVLAVAAERPALARSVVTLGAFALRDREASQAVLDFATSEGMADDMRTRFLFGLTGTGAQSRAALVDDLVGRGPGDWLISDIVGGLRHEVEWSLRDLPDGSWVHLPRPSTVQAGYRVAGDDPYFPDLGLFERITMPIWQVISVGGQDDDMFDAGRCVGEQYPHVTFVKIEGGFAPHYKAPDDVAGLIVEAAATP